MTLLEALSATLQLLYHIAPIAIAIFVFIIALRLGDIQDKQIEILKSLDEIKENTSKTPDK